MSSIATSDINLAAWWGAHGLEVSHCEAIDPKYSVFAFDDPDGRAPRLAAEFREEHTLLAVLRARRRLVFLSHVAREAPNRLATQREIAISTPCPAPGGEALTARTAAR